MGDAPAFNLLGRQFRPNDKGFDGASGQPRRDDPVEFEAEDNEADPFGLDEFLSEAQKKGKPLDGIGAGSGMAASTGGSMSVSISSRERNEPMPETTTMAPPSEQPATDPPAATTLDPATDPPAATTLDPAIDPTAARDWGHDWGQ